jgi:hypothetical protein
MSPLTYGRIQNANLYQTNIIDQKILRKINFNFESKQSVITEPEN